MWRDQNEVASKAVQRRVKIRDKEDEEDIARKSLSLSPPTVPKTPPQDNAAYAINFFFGAYILRPMDLDFQQGYLDCLLPLWNQTEGPSPLQPAVTAVAFALLEAWSFLNPNSTQSLARSHYITALTAVRTYLSTAETVDDAFLMSILMLHMYEGITAFCGARLPQGPHMIGTPALIENRRRQPVNGEISERLLLGIRSQVVGRSLMTKETISGEMLNWSSNWSHIPKTPGFTLGDIECDVSNLQAFASKLGTDQAHMDSFAMEVLAKSNELDGRLVSWAADIPERWVPAYIWDPEDVPENVREAGFYRTPCIVYSSVWIANFLNVHASLRIKVQLVVLNAINFLANPTFDPAKMRACENIQDLADAICCSVPYFLGDRLKDGRIDDKSAQYPTIGDNLTPADHYDTASAFSGIFLTQRLGALMMPGLPMREGQREWIFGQMRRIRRIYRAIPHQAP